MRFESTTLELGNRLLILQTLECDANVRSKVHVLSVQ